MMMIKKAIVGSWLAFFCASTALAQNEVDTRYLGCFAKKTVEIGGETQFDTSTKPMVFATQFNVVENPDYGEEGEPRFLARQPKTNFPKPFFAQKSFYHTGNFAEKAVAAYTVWQVRNDGTVDLFRVGYNGKGVYRGALARYPVANGTAESEILEMDFSNLKPVLFWEATCMLHDDRASHENLLDVLRKEIGQNF